MRRALAPPRYLNPVIAGVDISTSGVKAVVLEEEPRGLVLARYAEAILATDAFDNGEFAEPHPISEALVRVMQHVGAGNASAALPESKSYLFEMTVAGATKEECRVLIEQHLDELIPLPPAEAALDFLLIGSAPEGEQKAVGVGFARRILDAELAVFDEAGIDVVGLDSETFAMARALVPPGDTSTTLIVDIGKTTTKIAIVAKRIPRFTTTINVGGHAFTRAVQKYFGVTEQEARRVKAEHGLVREPGNDDYLCAMLSTAAAIRDEIERRFLYWQERTKKEAHEPITRVLLVGGNASVRGLPEYLEAELHTRVTVGDVFTNLLPRDHRALELGTTESLAYATAIGLALRAWPRHAG